MRIKGVVSGVVLSCFLVSSAWAVDITITDPFLDATFAAPGVSVDDGNVEAPSVANQSWDLEMFDLTGGNLSLSGGFDFLTGKGAYNNGALASGVYPQGDIFVYLGNAPADDWAAWDYVISFERLANEAAATGNIKGYPTPEAASSVNYAILSRAVTGTTYLTYGADAAKPGLPWVFDPVPTVSYQSAGYSIAGDVNTISGIDVSSILGGGGSAYFHTTMRCGNDVLWGETTTSVPDGGTTLVLLGLGLVGMAAARRRM